MALTLRVDLNDARWWSFSRRSGITGARSGFSGVTIDKVPITVFWRPGCVSCARLRSGLLAAGVQTHEVNIWQDEKAAEAVRSVAHGNETVPTVTIGTTILVNPSLKSVLAEIGRQSVERPIPAQGAAQPVSETHRSTLEVAQWFFVVLFLALSFLAEGLRLVALSWALDAVNIAVYLLLKVLRNSRTTPTSQ